MTLRDYIADQPAWKAFAKEEAVMSYMKAQLIEAVETEQETGVRNKICDTLSVLAGSMLADEHTWPELQPKLFQWAGTEGPGRKAALGVLATLAEYLGRSLFVGGFQQQIRDVLAASIGPPNSMEVRETCVRACARYISLLDNAQEREYFSPLLGPMLTVVADALNQSDELVARHTVELLIEVAEADNVAFFKPAIEQVSNSLGCILSQICDPDPAKSATNHTFFHAPGARGHAPDCGGASIG